MQPSGCLSAGSEITILERYLGSEEGSRERGLIGRASTAVTRGGGDGGEGRDGGK